MRVLWFAVAALVSLAGVAPASELSIDAETFTLPNGMTVVLYQDRSLPKVAVNTWFHVGSKDEKEHRTGFAHLFEHLMFMGTDRVPDNQYDLILEGGGAWSNASTSSDRTNYYSVGPSALLPTMLWLEADRLDGLADAMTQDKLDSQRDVVRNERRESENSPYGRADLRLGEAMYPVGHPYHHPIIGSHEDLEAATVEDVTEFFRRYYVPGNATVVVAGDFDADVVRPLVKRFFGALAAKPTPDHRVAAAPELSGELRLVETDKVEFPRLTLSWHSPAYFRDGDGEMDLTAGILASGSASRLEQRLMYEEELVQNVVAYQSSAELSSTFVIEAIAAPDVDLEDIKTAILEEVAEYVSTGPTAAELERNKAQLEAGFLRRMESLPSRADRINTYRHYYGVTDGFQRDLDRWTKPTRASVKTWAARVFGPNRVDMRVFPEGAALAGASLDERPADLPVGEFHPPTATTFTLSNGVAVHAISRPGTRLFDGRLIVRSGENGVPAEQAGLADLTSRVMNAGAGGLSAAEFAEAVETLGANVWIAGGRSSMTAGVSGISSRMDEALDLFSQAVLAPNLEAADFDREQALLLGAIRAREDNPEALCYAVGRSLLFDEPDPRSRPFEGTEATVSALTLDDVRSVVPRLFHPDAATFTFVGDFELEALRAALEKRFRKWKGSADVLPLLPVLAREGQPRFVLVDRPDAPQTVVYAARLVPALDGQARAVRLSAATVFGGSFTSRVNGNLREENGFTYGAYGQIGEQVDHTLLTAQTNVFTDVTGKALVELRSECNGMATDPPSDDEARKAVETRRTDLIDTAQSTGSASAHLANLVTTGRPLDAATRDLAALADVTAPAIREFAQTGFWNWSDLNVVLVGDRESVLKQLKEVGFPTPEIVDSYGRPASLESAATESAAAAGSARP